MLHVMTVALTFVSVCLLEGTIIKSNVSKSFCVKPTINDAVNITVPGQLTVVIYLSGKTGNII